MGEGGENLVADGQQDGEDVGVGVILEEAKWHYHVGLAPTRMSFQFIAKQSSLFYDEAHRMCIAVEQKRVLCYSVKGDVNTLNLTLGITPDDSIVWIKCDWDLKRVAVVTKNHPLTVRVYSTETGLSQAFSCRRSKNSFIRGIFWTNLHGLVLVTHCSVELYKVGPTGAPKLLKEVRLNILWFNYCASVRCLIACTSSGANPTVQPLYFRPDSVEKLPKFDVETQAETLNKEDVLAAQIYGRLYIVYISRGTHRLLLYQVTKEHVYRKVTISHPFQGSLMVQLVDHLLILHDKDFKISMIYDIRGKDPTLPVLGAQPMSPVPVFLPAGMQAPPPDFDPYSSRMRLIQPNLAMWISDTHVSMWEVVVNLEEISLEITDLVTLIELLLRRSNAKPLILRLLRSYISEMRPLYEMANIFDVINENLSQSSIRSPNATAQSSNTQAFIPASSSSTSIADANSRSQRNFGLSAGSSSIMPSGSTIGSQGIDSHNGSMQSSTLSSVSEGWNGHASAYSADSTETMNQGASMELWIGGRDVAGQPNGVMSPGSRSGSGRSAAAWLGGAGGEISVITQQDMYAHVFSTFEDDSGLSYAYLLGCLTEYVRSLNYRYFAVEHFLFKMIVDILIKHNMFFQLHQYLQYHVITDSEHVACQLLALQDVYPPAYQLALDMFLRLGKVDEIFEVLLLRNRIISATHLIAMEPKLSYSCSRILDLAHKSGDPAVFISVFRFFENRGDISRNPDCQHYIQIYSDWMA